MPVGAEAAGYDGSALAYTAGRLGYDVGDADLFESSTSRQQLVETTTRSGRVRQTELYYCYYYFHLYKH